MDKVLVGILIFALLFGAVCLGFSLYQDLCLTETVGSCFVDGENAPRYQDELIIYTEDYERNSFGYEVLVEDDCNCIIDKDTTVELEDGAYILSGHGEAADFLRSLEVGDALVFLCDEVTAIRNLKDSTLKRIEIENERVDDIIESKKAGLFDIDSESISLLDVELNEKLGELKELFYTLNVDEGEVYLRLHEILDIINMKYYYTVESRSVDGRGMWHRPGATRIDESTLDGVKEFVKHAKALNINCIYLETYWHGMTTYYSDFLGCQHPRMSEGTYGEYGNDYVLAMISECHKEGIEVHAWVELLSAGRRPYIKDDWKHIDSETNEYSGFLDPMNDEVLEHLEGVISEMLDKYDFDGISYDYIRYPEESVNEYSDLEDAKREAVTEVVKNITGLIREKKPETVISASPYGYIDDAKHMYMQDVALWLEMGYLDVVLPMIYTEDEDLLLKTASEYFKYSDRVLQYTGISPLYNGASLIKNQQLIDGLYEINVPGVSLFASQNYITRNTARSDNIARVMSISTHKGIAVTPTSAPGEVFSAWSTQLYDRYLRIYSPHMNEGERAAVEGFIINSDIRIITPADTMRLLQILEDFKKEAGNFENDAVKERITEQIDYIYSILDASISRHLIRYGHWDIESGEKRPCAFDIDYSDFRY